MKKIIILLFIMLFCLCGCENSTIIDEYKNAYNNIIENNNQDSSNDSNKQVHTPVEIKESPDKYTAYIKDYVGRNCATIGYESLGGDRNDYVGQGYIHLVMISENGEYPGVSDEELKNYYVVDQSLEPNTEVKFIYEKDSEGNEYNSLIEWQNIEEIVLKIAPVGSTDKTSDKGLTLINHSPNKYTFYVRDYVGRNLASCGYISLGGDLRDAYGDGTIELVIIANDGTYIDLDDENIEDILKEYIVIGQGVAPNSEIKYEFGKDSYGNEYSFVDWQNREEIELYVQKIS